MVIAEVKTNQPCTLNGPWTLQGRQNIHRVLAAIGCLPLDHIEDAATDIYRTGIHESDLGYRIRLVAVGRDRSDDLAASHRHVILADLAGDARVHLDQVGIPFIPPAATDIVDG